jgi:hypothetical protein
MSRHILSLSHEQLTAFDLDALIAHAEALNQRNRGTFTTPFPKAPAGGGDARMPPGHFPGCDPEGRSLK